MQGKWGWWESLGVLLSLIDLGVVDNVLGLDDDIEPVKCMRVLGEKCDEHWQAGLLWVDLAVDIVVGVGSPFEGEVFCDEISLCRC